MQQHYLAGLENDIQMCFESDCCYVPKATLKMSSLSHIMRQVMYRTGLTWDV